MASSAAIRAIVLSRAAYFSLKPSFLPSQLPLCAFACKRRVPISCLISGVDGGGVSDEFVSTRKTGFGRDFSVIADMLLRIEPLDNSIISEGVSDSAKESMKQTISTMLGLLPSDQFSVTVMAAKHPLDRLIVSSIVTGYTLWNAEYRTSLMRNFDLSPDSSKSMNFADDGGSEVRWDEDGGGENDKSVGDGVAEGLEGMNLQNLENLSSEALSYIHQLESELSMVKQELHAREQENLQMEHIRNSNNDLLEYLRSLESHMVTELSTPSSREVEEIIYQVAENILQRFFKDDSAPNAPLINIPNCENNDNELRDAIETSRDYLAKLLFWCMLLGHHLRGLENRLHLSCVVGLL